MEIEGTPRIIVWFAAPDVQFLNPATNILRKQFGNFDVIGMTGEQPLKITLEGKNIPFIPLTALNGNGGGVRYSPCCRRLRKTLRRFETCERIKYRLR